MASWQIKQKVKKRSKVKSRWTNTQRT